MFKLFYYAALVVQASLPVLFLSILAGKDACPTPRGEKLEHRVYAFCQFFS
ncbi:MAG: hypothetical protein ABH886_05430 [Candidatus Desantisbacteria bacterium]